MNPLTIAVVFIVGAVGGIFGDKIISNFISDQTQRPVVVQKKEEIFIKENEAFEQALKKNIPLLASIEVTNIKPQKKGKHEEVFLLNGFMATSDGLIVSVADSRIKSNSKIQAFYNGKFHKLEITRPDTDAGIFVFKFKDIKDIQEFPTALLEENGSPALGARAMILRLEKEEKEKGKAEFFPFTTSAIVNSIKDEIIELSIARDKEKLPGAILVNEKGEIIGILKVSSEGQVTVISAQIIKESLFF